MRLGAFGIKDALGISLAQNTLTLGLFLVLPTITNVTLLPPCKWDAVKDMRMGSIRATVVLRRECDLEVFEQLLVQFVRLLRDEMLGAFRRRR